MLRRIVAIPGAGILISAITALIGPSVQAGALVCNRVYTFDADFAEGTLANVNYTDVSDQLQLNHIIVPFPFVNIACSGRGTIVRIDVNSGAILGEYLTAPDGMGHNPSRTTVDQLGNVWVSNRDEYSDDKGSVARIALVIGGTRCEADGTPNSSGQYLKPPFMYSTAVDRDGDGLIKTSLGLGNILAWTNAGGADSGGGVSTAEDECIVNYTRVAGTGARTLAVDAANNLWTGGLGDLDHELLSGITGQPIPGTQFNCSAGGYGGLIDGNGILWSARGGAGLLRYDPASKSCLILGNDWGDYGLGIDPATGNIWHSSYGWGVVSVYQPDGTRLAQYPQGNTWAQGVCVDGSGNVWVAHSLSGGTTVGHLRTDGTYVGSVPVGDGPTGVAVDANGKIWVANYQSSTAQRIDPTAGPIGGGGFPVGAVDLTVSLGSGAWPYNYSDMTGFVLANATAPSGTWRVVHDCLVPGTEWGTVSWNGTTPDGTSLKVEVRAADNGAALSLEPWTEVANGANFCELGLAGQLLEIQVTFTRSAGTTSTPVLSDLTVTCCNRPPDCSGAFADPAILWPPNHQWVPIPILGVTDPDGDPVTITIDAIRQDEPVATLGDGDTSPDGQGIGTSVAEVRAERSGTKRIPGNGRVYHIRFIADDGKGGTCSGVVRVGVPHDVKDTPVDEGPLYDSTLP